MKKKIFQSIALTSIVLVAISYFLCTFIIYTDLEKTTKQTLINETNSLAQLYNKNPDDFLQTKFYSESRITLIQADGKVLLDSRYNLNSLSNHSTRPEFIEAVKKGQAASTRYSDTLNESTYYYALKLDNGNILRLSTTSNTLISTLGSSFMPILLIFASVIVISLIIARILTQKIVDPINHLNLDIPLSNKTYPELQPLLENMSYHNKIRKEFSANVSHELKTPLTSISGYAEIMANNLQGDNTQEFSRKIVDESKQLLRIIEDIIKLSKLDEGNVQLDYETIDYQEVIQNVLRNLENYAGNANVALIDETLPVKGLAVRQIIYEIMYNLIQNAIKYNYENGHVWVSLRDRTSYIEIIVKDDGIGIHDKDKERVFERFYRSDKSHSKQIEGTGLGLAIVKHGVDFHNGTIEVFDYLNHGTKFVIKINK
ncbi:sensor histidine kinase [Anaerorhabdus sp.]|uniref:sensor histidine kinase n=1 Tax=Anaerorhabdus sp. TaxID=1872524 RepID=UPI002FC74B2F